MGETLHAYLLRVEVAARAHVVEHDWNAARQHSLCVDAMGAVRSSSVFAQENANNKKKNKRSNKGSVGRERERE